MPTVANAFLKMDDIPGESTDADHTGEIEVQSFSFGVTQPATATASSAGGGTVAMAQFHDLSIVKSVDLSSPKLHQACANGDHIPNCVLTMRRDSGNGSKIDYLSYTLNDAVISQYSIGGGSNDIPVESVGISFAKVQWKYVQQNDDGTPGGNAAGGYDLTAGKPM